MDAEYQVYASLLETVVKYLIPVFAVNFLTDISGRFIPQERKFQLMPIICVAIAGAVGSLYGYIEEETFRETVGHIVAILTISGFLFISGTYKAIKNRIVRIIRKDEKSDV